MPTPYPDKNKPPVLKRPQMFRRFLMILIALGVLIYLGVAATAFLKNQTEPHDTRDEINREKALNDQAN